MVMPILVARNSIANAFGRQGWFLEPPDFVTLVIHVE
jgi:hypothetical protein